MAHVSLGHSTDTMTREIERLRSRILQLEAENCELRQSRAQWTERAMSKQAQVTELLTEKLAATLRNYPGEAA